MGNHPMTADTNDDERTDDYPTREEMETIMGERNPETWEPEPDPDYYDSGQVNLSVRGTVGPDYLGQETVNVPGHHADRLPDMDTEHARKLALRGEFDDLGEHQPLPLLRSDMKADPIEGTQGTYAVVVPLDDPCPECAQEWGVAIHYTLPGEVMEKCLVCGEQVGGTL